MITLERAQEIRVLADELLAAAGVAAVVTLNPDEIPGALPLGPVVLVQPGTMDFTTYSQTDAEWQLLVITGPVTDRLRAWGAADAVISALQVPLSLTRAEPANFQPAQGPIFPAFLTTFTETILEQLT